MNRQSRLDLLSLESRDVPASYLWDNLGGTLSLTLATGESLTISETGGNVSFTSSNSVFTTSGANLAVGNATGTITIPLTNLSTSISVGNVGATTGTNNVTLAGGQIQSANISIAAASTGTTSAIAFTTATTDFGTSTVNLTARSAGITGTAALTSAGTLTLAASGNTINLTATGTDLGTFAVTAATSVTLTDVNTAIIGAGGLIATTASLQSGSFQLSASNLISDSSSITLGTTATLNLNSNSETIAGLLGTGAVTLGSGTLTLNTTSSSTFGGSISGFSGNLTKLGSGSVTLTGTASYSGTTTLTAGTLAFNTTSSLSTSSIFIASGATVGFGSFLTQSSLNVVSTTPTGAVATVALLGNVSSDLDFSSATLANVSLGAIGNATYTGNLTPNSGVYRLGGGSGTLTVSSVLVGANNVVVSGAGSTVILNSANTYSGTTSVQSGTLVAANASALGTTSSGTTVAVAGTLALQGNVTISGEALTLASTANAPVGLRNLSGNNNWNGPIVFEPVSFTSIRTFSGGDVGEGLDLDGSFTYAVNVRGPAVGAIRDANFTSSESGGTPGVTVTSQNEILSWVTANLGISQNDTRLATVMSSLRWSAFPNNLTVSMTTTPGQIYKLQLLFLDGNYGRGTDITVDGTLLYDNYPITGSQNGVTNGTRGSVFTYMFTASRSTTQVVLGGDGPFADRNPILNGFTLEALTAFDSDSDPIPATIQSDSGTLTLAGPIDATLAAIQFGGASNISVTGIISGNGSVNKVGTGTTTLANVNTYTSTTTVTAGTLLLAGGNSIPNSSVVETRLGGTLQLTANLTISQLKGSGVVALGANTLTIGSNNASSSFYGTISGTGGLTKIGTGTITLGGPNTYTGGTNILAGSLQLDKPRMNVTTQLTAWYDANNTASVVTDVNGFVSAWNNITPNTPPANTTFVQGSITAQPKLVPNAIGSLPVIRFDGNDQLVNTYNPNTPYSIYTVSRMQGTQN